MRGSTSPSIDANRQRTKLRLNPSLKGKILKSRGPKDFVNIDAAKQAPERESENENVDAKKQVTTSMNKSKNDTLTILDFKIVYDKHLLHVPNTKLSTFLFMDRAHTQLPVPYLNREQKRRKIEDSCWTPLTNQEFDVATIQKFKSNFDKPSPDDEVERAQENAFAKKLDKLDLSKNIDNLKGKPKKLPKNTKPFKNIDVKKEILKRESFKQHKSFVIIGHVDAGKSTLMGRILFETGAVDGKTVNNLIRQSEKMGKGSFALAWIMDQTAEERARGVTIDICATNFETESTRYTAIDAPGHKDFVPQTINGISQADIALLVIDSISGEFEAGFDLNGQTKEHALLAKSLGIEDFCVIINKMDKENWSSDRFSQIKFQMLEYLTGPELNVPKEKIEFIPLSGLTGNNVVKRNASVKPFQWYQGPTLIEYLELVKIPAQNRPKQVDDLLAENFKLSINDVFEVSTSEFAIGGKVYSGVIQPGQTIRFAPSDEYLQIQSMKVEGNITDFCAAGDTVEMKFKTQDLENKNFENILIGDLVLSMTSPITSTKHFTAKLNLFNLPKPLLVGTPFVCFRNTSHVSARITNIRELYDLSKKIKKHLTSNQSALVDIEVLGDRPLPITRYSEDKFLGRVVIRKEGVTIGAGIIIDE